MIQQGPPTSLFIPAEAAEVEQVGAKTHYWYTKPGLVHTDKINFIRVTLPPGEYHDFHNHPGMEEVLYVTAGTAEQWLETECRILKAGDAVHIPKGLIHATFNAGDDELEFLAVLAPADSTEPMTVDHSQEEPWKSLRQNA
jgi:quercetin dioxygenase-like cupin family protein